MTRMSLKVPAAKRPQHLVSAPSQAAHPPARPGMKLSILMPVYNEQRTIAAAIAGIIGATCPCDYELIVIDDGSTDGTPRILEALDHPRARVITHPRNLGKGAALQTGASISTGSHLVPFDADLEYDPRDLAALVEPVLRGRCEVVYGARLLGANTRFQSYRHAIGNRALTMAANMMFNAYLSDLHTCLKLMPVQLFSELNLSEDGFGLDTEVTAKLLERGIRPFEVPVAYHSRSVEHGKKITWRDGVACLRVLARVRSGRRTSRSSARLEDPLEVLALSMSMLAELDAHPPRSTELSEADHPLFDGSRRPEASA
jgi:dolichol-phosphate hexosyltransferase